MRKSSSLLGPVQVLLSGLWLLAACGGGVEEGPAPVENSVGVTQGALCSGLSVTQLAISDVSSYEGVLGAVGTWGVSLFANAVRLEYYVDGVLRSYDERPGTSDTWYHSSNGLSCGTHTFKVRAYPMVIDSNGNRTTCIDSPTELSQSFTDTSCMCVINGETYLDGKKNPSNACQICDISQSRTSWSFNPDGYIDTSGYCKSFLDGSRICVNSSTFKNGMACTSNSDCYLTCGELL